MNDNLFVEGLQLMAAGMIVVFCFLVLMVFAMNISAAVLKRLAKYFPEEQPAQSGGGADNSIIAAVIAAARAQANK
ncbi:oxaloacetate decarboxylase subunit gamma [Limihaloglobus sulfuriphilus]|uniref:Oxaloacetate decarboxylase subunit gamma n=1 Tax=Limihaloglobus sulfuriphilus TaxID=1851148 RepID=A0A1R7T681_9BACT|nr:OadG family transporter subunit [Limihaloglobus sulfuriphilus]AQQ72473.1 oxaloacetate decarboxylase subunit gamma [Limihaloglobus sulfuriphilus]